MGYNMLQYTVDYTSPHEDFWREILGPLRGTQLRMAEVGCLEGRSSRWFVENILTHPRSQLDCVDTWDDNDVYQRFWRNTVGLSKIRAVRGNSSTLVWDEVYDVIYLDADHKPQSVLIDACNSWQALKSGGILIFDDYRLVDPSRAVDVAPAINAFCGVMGLTKQYSPWDPTTHQEHDWGQVVVRKSP